MSSRKAAEPTIRQYRRGDDPHVWALAAAASIGHELSPPPPLPLQPASAAPTGMEDLAAIGKVFQQSGGDFLVAEINGNIVGTAGLLPADQRAADVVRVAVHPGVRRQGVGTALMEAVERRAVELGIRRLRLDVGEGDDDAIAFYLASGFNKLDNEDESEQRWDVNFFSKALRPGRS